MTNAADTTATPASRSAKTAPVAFFRETSEWTRVLSVEEANRPWGDWQHGATFGTPGWCAGSGRYYCAPGDRPQCCPRTCHGGKRRKPPRVRAILHLRRRLCLCRRPRLQSARTRRAGGRGARPARCPCGRCRHAVRRGTGPCFAGGSRLSARLYLHEHPDGRFPGRPWRIVLAPGHRTAYVPHPVSWTQGKAKRPAS